jgi:cytochrome d ubiquinol oxidase subunit II
MATLWFCFITILLGIYVVLDGFDLGVGIVQLFVADTSEEKLRVMSTIAGVCSGNEVWLLAFGSAIFLAFPALYASALSGFYLAIIMAIWLLILRGVSIEFRGHMEGPIWPSFWDAIFGGASFSLALLYGITLGNIVRGVPLGARAYFFLPFWTDFSAGTGTGVIDWYSLLVGVTALLSLSVHGSLWVIVKTDGILQQRTRSFAAKCWLGLVCLLLLISILSFRVQPILSEHFARHPWGAIFPASAAAGLLGMRILGSQRKDEYAFLTSTLYLVGMLTSAAFGVFPNLLISNVAQGISLTIYNAAAGVHGLAIGSYWLIAGILMAVGYSVFIYRHFARKIQGRHHPPELGR